MHLVLSPVDLKAPQTMLSVRLQSLTFAVDLYLCGEPFEGRIPELTNRVKPPRPIAHCISAYLPITAHEQILKA